MKYCLLILLAILTIGCNKSTNNQAAEISSSNSIKLEELQKKIEEMNKRLGKLQLENILSSNKSAYMTIGGDGYSLIDYDLGTLTVKIEDVTPYANSSKVKLLFGNPLGATITGLKGILSWGSVDEKGFPSEELGEKELSISKPIIAGSWNSVTVTLDNADPKKLGFVRLQKLTSTGIRLSGPN